MGFCWKPINKLTSCILLIKWHFLHYGTKWHETQTSEFIHSTVSKQISMYLKALCCLNTFVRKEQYCVFVFLLLLAHLPSLLFLRFYLFFRLLSFHLLLPLVLAPVALAWTVPPTWAACQREKHTCSGFTCGGMADRHSRSLWESHLELKIALCLRREGSWKVYSEREIETLGLFLSHASVCGNPRRDFLVKTLLPFFKNQIYWSIFTCVRLPWCLNSSFSWTKNKIKAVYCAASLVNTPSLSDRDRFNFWDNLQHLPSKLAAG